MPCSNNIWQPHGPSLVINSKISGAVAITNFSSEPVLAIHDYIAGASDPGRIIGNVVIIGGTQTSLP
jgi:hypothetical protein